MWISGREVKRLSSSGIGNGGKEEAADIPIFLQRREKH